MSLPQPLDRFELGEVIGHLRTAGQVPFLDADGEETSTSLWFVACRDRAWLLAATGDQRWCLADTEVRLDKGWTWDALVVGRWAAPLRPGTRKQAEKLLQSYRLAERDGDPIPAPSPEPPDRIAPVARGAHGIPDWVAARIPAPPDAHWLLGFQTGRRHPRAGRDGSVHHDPVWLLLSDRHQMLATEQGWSRPVEQLELVERTARRDLLLADGWTVPGPGISEPYSALAAQLVGASPELRWAHVLRFLVERGDADAGPLLAHAFRLGLHTASWELVGQLALASDQPDHAVLAAREALRYDPSLSPRESAVHWVKQKVDPREAPPAGLFAELDALSLPEGLPWPVSGALEVWGTAAVLVDRESEGLALWETRGITPRASSARAAVASRSPGRTGWRAWVEAAERWRPHDAAEARRALAHALVHAPEIERPALHWQLASWAHHDGEPTEAHWRQAVVAPPPDQLVQSAGAWREAARNAEQQESWSVASLAWKRAWSVDAFEIEALLRSAHLAEQRLDDRPLALEAWEELERRVAELPEPDPSPYTVRLEIARLAELLERPEVAEAALRRAVQGDFLSLAAWDGVLRSADHLLTEAELAWFAHVRACLAGEASGSTAPLRTTLQAGELDALHPGGVGWLEHVRQSVDTASPPPRTELTRGLERLQPERYPVLGAAVQDLSTRLGIEPPEVYLFRGDGAWGLSAWPTEPPLVLVGHDHLEEAGPLAMSRPALTFALAVELTHLAARHPLLAFDGGLVGTSRSVYEAFGRYAGTAETVVDVVTLLPGVDQIAKIQTLIKLSRRVFTARSVVDKASEITSTSLGFLGLNGPSDEVRTVGRTFDGVALQFRLQADRAALLLTGDLQHAVEAVLCSDPNAAHHRATARTQGLLAVLPLVPPDARLRLASLVEFATTLDLPETSDSP